MTRITAAVVAALGVALSVNSPSFAQMVDKVDLATLSCKDLMSQTDRDREATIAFIHGYLLGKKQTVAVDIQVLAAATDKIVDECLDNPKEKAMDVFARND